MSRRRVPIRQSALVIRFADKLREVRFSRGMTQAQLAELANVTRPYMSRLEAGKIAPGIDMLERLALVLAVPATDLLPIAAVPDPLPALKEQARRMVDFLLEKADSETFLRLNPFLSLLVEASSKRGTDRRK